MNLHAEILIFTAAVWAASAQTPPTPNPAAPPPGRGGFGGPALKSPEVSADGRVTLRLRAPNAKEVFVTGMGARLAMQKNEQGVWTATTDPMKPDIYSYSFGLLAEHDITDRTLKTGTLATFRQTASYGQLFWAAREWLVVSLIGERLRVESPYAEHLNAAKFELAARLSSQASVSVGPRLQWDPVSGRITRSVVFQLAVKTVH